MDKTGPASNFSFRQAMRLLLVNLACLAACTAPAPKQASTMTPGPAATVVADTPLSGTPIPTLSLPPKFTPVMDEDPFETNTATSTPKKATTTATPSITPTMTEIPEELRFSFESGDGRWIVHESIREIGLQVFSSDGRTKWAVPFDAVAPNGGTSFSWFYFLGNDLFLGVSPYNVEAEVMRRVLPSYSVYKLNLLDGSLTPILERKPDPAIVRFSIYVHFDIAPDGEQIIYSHWYSQEIVIRNFVNNEQTAIPIPPDYLIAGGFFWSEEYNAIAFTLWQDDYALNTNFAIASIDLDTLELKILFEDDDQDYFLLPHSWEDSKNLILFDRRLEDMWRLDLETGILTRQK